MMPKEGVMLLLVHFLPTWQGNIDMRFLFSWLTPVIEAWVSIHLSNDANKVCLDLLNYLKQSLFISIKLFSEGKKGNIFGFCWKKLLIIFYTKKKLFPKAKISALFQKLII